MPVDATAAKEAIATLRDEHVAAVNASDLERVLSGMTDDVVYMPPGQPAIVGKRQLEDFLRPLYEQLDASISMIAEQIEVAGDSAYEWGTLSGEFRLGVGPTISMNGKYLYVYRRLSDGTWKIARDIYNDTVPATAKGDRE